METAVSEHLLNPSKFWMDSIRVNRANLHMGVTICLGLLKVLFLIYQREDSFAKFSFQHA